MAERTKEVQAVAEVVAPEEKKTAEQKAACARAESLEVEAAGVHSYNPGRYRELMAEAAEAWKAGGEPVLARVASQVAASSEA